MLNKDLNTAEKELVEDGILTDELINFFRDIDVMNSVGMMAWLVKTAKSGLKRIEKGSGVTYQGKLLTKDEYRHVLNENLSDLLISRIFQEKWTDKLLNKFKAWK